MNVGASRWGKSDEQWWLCIDEDGVRESYEYFDTQELMEARAIRLWGADKWREIYRARAEWMRKWSRSA